MRRSAMRTFAFLAFIAGAVSAQESSRPGAC